MALEQIINQIKTIHENIVNLDFDAFRASPGGPYPEWNGLTLEDFISSYQDMLDTQKDMIENNVLEKLSWNILHSMNQQMSQMLQHSQAFFSSKNQQTFHSAFQHLESMRTNYLSWGVKYLIQIGKSLEDKSQQLDTEIQKLLRANVDIDKIKENVNKLIEPAVAGSLSKSFESRKTDLHKNQDRWYKASLWSAIICIAATIAVVYSIVGLFDEKSVVKLLEANGNKNSGPIMWTTVFLRVAILLPIYSVFMFSFSQYRKERNLEEEYAHKSAVATSLPNYGNLAVDDTVKDQILSEASEVIFRSPTQNKEGKGGKKSEGIPELNSLLENLQKLIPKIKDE